MTLTWPIIGVVLFGALLHASWNVLVKSSTDKALDTVLIHLIGSLVALPLLAIVGLPPEPAWPFIFASVVIHIAYYFALTGAYEHGDMALSYPLMRGVAPMLVALSATATLGEKLSFVAWIGVSGICMGVLVLGLNRHAFDNRRAVYFALANAVVIAIYTVVDGIGARAALAGGGNAVQYVVLLFVLDGWPFALLELARRGRNGRTHAWTYARSRWIHATGGALASLGSYGIALWAMTQAPVAMVAALREVSVLFAAVLGVVFLKEAVTPHRVIGTCVIVVGVMALRLG